MKFEEFDFYVKKCYRLAEEHRNQKQDKIRKVSKEFQLMLQELPESSSK